MSTSLKNVRKRLKFNRYQPAKGDTDGGKKTQFSLKESKTVPMWKQLCSAWKKPTALVPHPTNTCKDRKRHPPPPPRELQGKCSLRARRCLKERESERERRKETSLGLPPARLTQGSSPQPKHVPWPGIQLATFRYMGRCPTNSHTGQGYKFSLFVSFEPNTQTSDGRPWRKKKFKLIL